MCRVLADPHEPAPVSRYAILGARPFPVRPQKKMKTQGRPPKRALSETHFSVCAEFDGPILGVDP